jgi:hypothetical protein
MAFTLKINGTPHALIAAIWGKISATAPSTSAASAPPTAKAA